MTCLSKEMLKNYLNPILVETGTYKGDGVQVAKDSGFKKIISIEASRILCEKASERFQDDNNILIIYGDSTKILWSVIKGIKEKITFVLDAHNLCYGDDTRRDNRGLEWWPLVKELQIIAQHPRKDHTILIDDVRLFESHFGTSITQVKLLLLEINPNYRFHFMEGIFDDRIVDNNILVATMNEKRAE